MISSIWSRHMVNVNKDAIGGDAIGTADSFWAAWPLPALTFWNHNWSQIRTPLGHQVYKIRWRNLFQLTYRETVRKEPRRKAKRNILGGCNKKVSYRKQTRVSIHVTKNLATAGGMIDPVKIFLTSSLITMQNLVAVSRAVRAHLKDPKN